MGVSKVDFYGETLVDLTGDTITEETALEGTIFTDRTGEKKIGKYVGLDTTSSVPALATDIVGGKEAFVNGEKVIGSLRQTYANAYDWSLLDVEGLYGESLVQGTIELETSVTDDIIMRKGSYLGVRLPCSEFGDAKPEEVLSGKIFTSSSGYKKKGTYVPLDTTSSNPVTASDMVKGKEAYVNGVKVTGNVLEITSGTMGTNDMIEDLPTVQQIKTVLEMWQDSLLRAGSKIETIVPYEEFGDATAEDVTEGKIFTSASGFKVRGTKNVPSRTETWTLTLEDGSTTTKVVYVD